MVILILGRNVWNCEYLPAFDQQKNDSFIWFEILLCLILLVHEINFFKHFGILPNVCKCKLFIVLICVCMFTHRKSSWCSCNNNWYGLMPHWFAWDTKKTEGTGWHKPAFKIVHFFPLRSLKFDLYIKKKMNYRLIASKGVIAYLKSFFNYRADTWMNWLLCSHHLDAKHSICGPNGLSFKDI